jgi:hypothetical protein
MEVNQRAMKDLWKMPVLPVVDDVWLPSITSSCVKWQRCGCLEIESCKLDVFRGLFFLLLQAHAVAHQLSHCRSSGLQAPKPWYCQGTQKP